MEFGIGAWNRYDHSAWLSQFSDDFELINPAGLQGKGLDVATQFYALWHDGFPDAQVRAQNIVEEGDVCVLEGVFDGTHTGVLTTPAGAVPATQRHVSVPYVIIAHARAGKFHRIVLYYDPLSLMAQLGLISEPVPA
jgi:predicted ester cyclase